MSNGQPAVSYSWTDSYAHIRNPYLVVLVRVVVAIFIVLWIVTTVFHLPSNFELRRSSILALAATSNDLSGLGISIEAVALYNLVVVEAVFLFSIVAGLLIILNRSDDWLAILVSICLVSYGTTIGYDSPLEVFLAISRHVAAYITVLPILCLFPDARFVPRWSRWLMLPYIAVVILQIYNEYAQHDIYSEAPRSAAYLALIIFWLLGVVSLLQRLRQVNDPGQQQQIRQMVWGLLIVLVSVTFVTVLPIIPVLRTSMLVNVVFAPLATFASFMIFLILLTSSILRYRLWEINRVVNQGVVYGALIVILAMVFVGVLLLLDAGLRSALGSQQTALAGMLSAGAVVGLFNPVRLRSHMIKSESHLA